jgi:hypothetical protein
MALLIACGAVWRYMAPSHISSTSHRRALTDLVFYILLPAMVLDVIWHSPLDTTALKVSLIAGLALFVGATVMWLSTKLFNLRSQQIGALILAGTFPNATYMGLPVLTQTLGDWSKIVVMQYDYMACTPILLSLGVLLAKFYGGSKTTFNPLKELLKVPPLWAMVIGLSLQQCGIQQPQFAHSVLQILGGGVVPLMLIVLGMSIRWQSLKLKMLPVLLPSSISSLVIIPLFVYFCTQLSGLSEPLNIAVVLLAAMPTMVFGVVICERYQLDSELYAAAVTFNTVLSMLSLPIWYSFLQT